MGMESSTPALGCAVAYPLGVIGVILAVLLIRKALVRKQDLEVKEKDDNNKTYIAAFQVHNPAIFNKSIKDIAHMSYPKFVISRLWRDGNVSIPTSEKILKEGDRLLVVTSEKDALALTVLFGEQENTDWNKEDIDWNAIDSQLISQRIVVTRPELNGKKLGALRLRNHYGINISRVYRSGVQLLATPELTLQLGDRLTVVGEAAAIQNVEKVLGNAVKSLKEPNLVAVFIGIIGPWSHSDLHSGHQCSGEVRFGGWSYHCRYPYRYIRAAYAYDYLYHSQCQSDASCIRIIHVSGLSWTGRRSAFLRYCISSRRAVMDWSWCRIDYYSYGNRGSRCL